MIGNAYQRRSRIAGMQRTGHKITQKATAKAKQIKLLRRARHARTGFIEFIAVRAPVRGSDK